MSDLYDVGAEVLGWMQGFVEENPGVVNGVAAGTVTLGGFLAVLTAVTTAIKVGSTAMGLFTATLGPAAPVLVGVAWRARRWPRSLPVCLVRPMRRCPL